MLESLRGRRGSLLVMGLLLVAWILASAPNSLAQQPDTGVEWDQPMRIPSPTVTNSWFPDLAVDSDGRVHVIWCETGDFQWQDPDEPKSQESVYYSVWNGQYWLSPNDIVSPQQDIIRNAIAVDERDMLHMLYDHSPPFALYYKRTPVDQAPSAAAWTQPRLVNGSRHTYMSDIASANGTLHIVYDDLGAEGENIECPKCADIFYRQSTNGGTTWSPPVNLYPTHTGSSRAQIEVDTAGTIHVAWDEGWDRLSGAGDPRYGIYVRSGDGGITWDDPVIVSRPYARLDVIPTPTRVLSPTVTPGPLSGPMPTSVPRPTITPTVVSYATSSNAQLSVGSNGQGGVMLVWRTRSTTYPGIYYSWSTDSGKRWSFPTTLPGIVARRWGSPFDVYEMAVDSAGHIHLLVVGHLSETRTAPKPDSGPPGLYHFEWDGTSWAAPSPIYEGSWYPEYPHIIVHAGNHLYATWFAREDPLKTTLPHQVWYAHGQTRSPTVHSTLAPTLTPAPPSPGTNATTPPSPVPHPTLDLDDSGLPDNVRTESDEVFRLMVALAPVVSIILVVIAFRTGWLGQSK